jgi:hypothetical protein
MISLDPTLLYTFVTVGTLLSLLISHGLQHVIIHCRQYCSRIVYKHLIYPVVILRTRFSDPICRVSLLLEILHLVFIIVCCLINVQSITAAADRAGILSVVHLVPLLLGLHQAFAADLLKLTLQDYRRFHSWLGITAFLLVIFHAIVRLCIRHSAPLVLDRIALFGTVVSRFLRLVSHQLTLLEQFLLPCLDALLHYQLTSLSVRSIPSYAPSTRHFR